MLRILSLIMVSDQWEVLEELWEVDHQDQTPQFLGVLLEDIINLSHKRFLEKILAIKREKFLIQRMIDWLKY